MDSTVTEHKISKREDRSIESTQEETEKIHK